MTRLHKAILVSLLVGMLGVMASVVPIGVDLEENIGLDLLFKLRGIRTPPSEVVIVSLDKASVDTLQLPTDPEKWPRSLHANLIENWSKKVLRLLSLT